MAKPDHGAIIPAARGWSADLNRFFMPISPYFAMVCRLFIETSINHDRQLTTVRPELVEGLRQAQPERCGVMNYENINRSGIHAFMAPSIGEPHQAFVGKTLLI